MKRILLAIAILPFFAAPCMAEEPMQLARMGPVALGAGVSAAPAGIAYVASSGASAVAEVNTQALAFGASTAAGDLLIVVLGGSGTVENPIVGSGTFEDDRGNTWTRDISLGGGVNMQTAIYSAIAKDSGVVTVTATYSGSCHIRIACAAFRNVTNNTVDDSATASTSTANAHAGDIEPTGSAVIVGFLTFLSGANTITADENWSLVAESEANNKSFSFCYRIVSSSGTYNDGWTVGSAAWLRATTVAYK